MNKDMHSANHWQYGKLTMLTFYPQVLHVVKLQIA